MTRRPRSIDDAENLNDFVTFTGTISHGVVVVPIRFRVRFGTDGELRFRVYPIPMTREALALGSEKGGGKSGRSAFCAISAVSAGGIRFESTGIILRSNGTRSTPTTAHVTLGLGYTHATFTLDQDNGDTPPTIRWSLRGFECFPHVEASGEFGRIAMQGSYPSKTPDRVTGVASIHAPATVADTAKWLAEAEALFRHVRDCMSFAVSQQIGYPVRDTWVDGQWRRDAYSQTKSRRSVQHVHHPMRLQEVLDAAVNSHFNPPIPVRNLGHAIEWLTLSTTYTEMRLTNVMTALENLANSNLSEEDQLYLPKKKFDAFAKRLRTLAVADLDATFAGSDPAQLAVIEAMRAAMPGKFLDLNRRPLFEKIMTLAAQWGVPLAGVNPTEIRAAILARNNIVHRGYYYEPGGGTREQADLWDHVLTMREVAIRFVLTVLGFRGTYLSFRGGQHDVAFPPPPT